MASKVPATLEPQLEPGSEGVPRFQLSFKFLSGQKWLNIRQIPRKFHGFLGLMIRTTFRFACDFLATGHPVSMPFYYHDWRENYMQMRGSIHFDT